MNTLSATLTAHTSTEHVSLLTTSVGEDHFYLLLAEPCHDRVGAQLTLAFKETEVILASAHSATTANIQRAIVSKIERGTVLSQIALTYHETSLIALMPTLTFNTLAIGEGDEIHWMVQPSEISLLRGTHGE